MRTYRLKLSAPLGDLTEEINRLLKVDVENQAKYSPGPGRPASGRLSARQMHVLTEGVFFAGYREFEGFLRDVFLLYCQEKEHSSGRDVTSYLAPRSFLHAEELLKSGRRFLDWANPNVLIERAETYLRDGFPVKNVLATRMETLSEMRRLRNHIAHKSLSSRAGYIKVLRKHYRITPLDIPSVGEFLLETDRRDRKRYKLIVYLDFLKETAQALV